MPHPTPLLALALAFLTSVAAAQGGYRSEEFPTLGLELDVPRDYRALPVEPTERWIALRWVDQDRLEERADDEDKPESQVFGPELMVLWIDYRPDPVATGQLGEDGEPLPPPEPPTSTFERYLAKYWRRGKGEMYPLTQPEVMRERDGNTVSEYVLPAKGGGPDAWATVFRNGNRSVVLFGRAEGPDWDHSVKIWRKMAKKAELAPPSSVDLEKWERFYRRRPKFVDPEYRLEVRSKLVRGWEADDTENYIFVYSTKDEPLLRDLKSKLEAIRAEFEVTFPPLQPITAVSTVRICRDRDEYIQYGGSPWSGGYWNSAAGELVFYDYKEDQEKKGEGLANSRLVLLHEAFHQYIYYSCGELPPHSWFNEGTGDFYGGAVIGSSKVKKIGVNPWRIGLIKRVVEEEPGRVVPFEQILAFEQAEFYRADRRSVCYAQAWSIIYFLRTSSIVRKHEQWSQILTVYFDSLREHYVRLTGELPEGSGRAEQYLAGVEARKLALADATAEIDLYQLQQAWETFVRRL